MRLLEPIPAAIRVLHPPGRLGAFGASLSSQYPHLRDYRRHNCRPRFALLIHWPVASTIGWMVAPLVRINGGIRDGNRSSRSDTAHPYGRRTGVRAAGDYRIRAWRTGEIPPRVRSNQVSGEGHRTAAWAA